MVTFTGFVFSVVLLMLQFWSSMYSPRAASYFGRDRTTQCVLALTQSVARHLQVDSLLSTIGGLSRRQLLWHPWGADPSDDGDGPVPTGAPGPTADTDLVREGRPGQLVGFAVSSLDRLASQGATQFASGLGQTDAATSRPSASRASGA